MGILDEAIREHLELKRRRGAPDSELQQLEDEAFGPPSRPGEPDFPDHVDAGEQSGNGLAHDGAAAESPSAPEAPIAPPPDEEPGAPDEPLEEPPLEEPPEEPIGDPDHGEEEAEAATALYDQISAGEPDAVEPEPAEHEGTTAEPPIESLDTVEHPMPDHEDAPPEPAGADEPEPAGEEEQASEESALPDEDDVLADTPDFLKDAPEDDELWFEQGKPKDFDF